MNAKLDKNVLDVIGSLGLGGAETQLVMLIKGVVSRGGECEVFVLDASGPLLQDLTDMGVKVHDGRYRTSGGALKRLAFLTLSFCKLFICSIRFRPDVLHAYLPLTNFMGALIGRLSGVSTVITSRRALGTHQDRVSYWKYVDRFTNFLSSAITVNSQAVETDTIQRDHVNPQKVRMIYNGFDFHNLRCDRSSEERASLREELGVSPDVLMLITVANLIPYKGHKDLIGAIPNIVAKYESVLFVFVGEDRGCGKDLIEYASGLNVLKYIKFLGQRSDVDNLLLASDIFILPSHEEGFSNALIEAMGVGLPVVATKVGGNSEALGFGSLGLLVSPKKPAEITVAVNYLLGREYERYTLGRKGMASVLEKYSVDKMVDGNITLYY